MENQMCISRNRTWIPGILCIALMISFSAFGQEQPRQQNRPAPAGQMNHPEAGGLMPQAMPDQRMPGPGMMGPAGLGGMSGGPKLEPRDSAIDLLRPEVQKELAITAEQRQKLEDIQFNSEKEAIQHRAALQVLHMELSRLINSENTDRAAIDKKIQEVAQEEAFLMRSSINARLNTRAILTTDQRAKLSQFMQKNQMRAPRPPAEGVMPPIQPASKPNPASP
jgi:Spy/CpxP family protein refolding chaperone